MEAGLAYSLPPPAYGLCRFVRVFSVFRGGGAVIRDSWPVTQLISVSSVSLWCKRFYAFTLPRFYLFLTTVSRAVMVTRTWMTPLT